MCLTRDSKAEEVTCKGKMSGVCHSGFVYFCMTHVAAKWLGLRYIVHKDFTY